MVEKCLLFFRTVRYLKIKQIIYQIYYRIKPAGTLQAYTTKSNNLNYQALLFSCHIENSGLADEHLKFNFLNQTHQFTQSIDWNFQGLGKLWNYNLQYFNYLHQENISDVVKQNWLMDIGKWLKSGQLKLEPYPSSLRIMNSLRYFGVAHLESRELLKETHAQLSYLSNNLEFHIMGNHLLENAFALFMGGHAFQEPSWQKKAESILIIELNEQILNDGAHFELSPMYHQLILFRLLELIDWYSKHQNVDSQFLDFLKEKTILMLGWSHSVTFENGDIPHFNDSTDNIAFTTKELFSFARKLGLKTDIEIPLKGSGYRKFRTKSYECILDSGSIAATYQPGHSHADVFSFIMHYQQSPLIVDVGISTYEKNLRRDFERSTRAHNTIEIANENQFEVWDSFKVGRRARVNMINESGMSVIAAHDGYKHHYHAIHERNFSFTDANVIISDVIKAPKKLQAKSYLHFHPDCQVELNENGYSVNDDISIQFKNASRVCIESYEFSLGYNMYRDAIVLIAEFNETLETTIAFN